MKNNLFYFLLFSFYNFIFSINNFNNNLICKKELISIFQSLNCKDGKIGIGLNCECDSSSPSSSSPSSPASSPASSASCNIATMTQYLPNLTLLNKYYFNSTQIICDDIFSNLLTKNIHTKSEFIKSHGYPLDIESEICKQKEELSLTSIRRYHPCSVSIGKFLRYNSLFEYHLFGRGTRVYGYKGNSHSQDTLVDFSYDHYPWRWAQGVPECEKLNLTSWNCAFSDVSSYYHFNQELLDEIKDYYYYYDLPNDTIESNQGIVDETRSSSSSPNSKKTNKKYKRNKQQQKQQQKQHQKDRQRELKEIPVETNYNTNSEPNIIKYDNVELIKGPNLIKLLRDIRFNRPNHISQFLLYGKILVMLSRPSDPAWNYLKNNLVFLSNGEYSEIDRKKTIKLMGDVRNGGYFPTQYQSSTTTSTSTTSKRIISVSMHVRQGDSCDYMVKYELPPQSKYLSSKSGERPCYHVDVYMKKLYYLQKIYGVNRVYLATDSHEMLQRIQSEKSFQWIYLNTSREIFGSSENSNSHFDSSSSSQSSSTNNFNQKNKFYNKKWIDFYSNTHNSVVTFSGVIDLFLMKFGDIFLGAFTSHYSKLSYYLMIGTKMKLLPFISLDYPLSCDTVNDCTHDEIKQINPSVLDIINWAPECRRVNDNGWMQGQRDPCGIYL